MQHSRITSVAFVIALAVSLAPASAFADPSAKPKAKGAVAAVSPRASAKSIGSPTEGHLVGGVHLTPGPHLRIVPVYASGDARWGLDALVGLIDRGARSVKKQFPDSVLSVGHLSKQGGGDIDRHASHESGRDADIGFYVTNQAKKPIYAEHFVAFKADGTAPSWPGAKFDDARNWAFIAAIVSDSTARVSHIFVTTPIRQRLLDYAAKIGAPMAVRVRASELMAQPKGALPHDDHFHVRIACPSGMDRCIEQPIAKHRPHGHAGATASARAHVAPRGGASRTSPHAAPPAPVAHPPAAKADSSKVAKKNDTAAAAEDEAKDDEETAKSDAIPSLAPAIPGLDAAIIPKPLTPAGHHPAAGKGAGPRAALPPISIPWPGTLKDLSALSPIDDPDGILDLQRSR